MMRARDTDQAKRRFQTKLREQLEEKSRAAKEGKPFDESTLIGKRGFPFGQVKQKITQFTPHLVTVAAKGTVEDVKKCIERHNDVNMADAQGYNAALHAAIHGHIRVTKVLVEQGNADLNMKAKDRNTPLHAAAAGGHVSLVTYLLRNKVDIEAQNSDGWTALNLAAQNGHREVVHMLLDEGADPDLPATEQWTPMMSAALNGHTEAIRMLLDKGADPVLKNEAGWTPMLLAARNSHIHSCEALHKQGVDIDDANYLGETAVLLGAKGGHINLVDWLVKKHADLDKPNEDGWTPLLFAAKAGYTGVCRVLVNGKVSVNKQNTKGWTAFATACYYGKIEVATVLARAGADLTLASDGGWTPLMYASKAGSHQMVHTLLQKLKVTNVDDQNGKGWTALMVAAKNGSAKIMKLLIDHGADVDIRNYSGASALTIALAEGAAALPIVKQVIHAGVDLERAPRCEVPAIAAAKSGQLMVVRHLYEMGVDVTQGDENGWTPLMEACRGGFGPIVAFLRDLGADIHAQSSSGWTARRAAEDNRHQQVAEVLTAQRNMNNPYVVSARMLQENVQRIEQFQREKENRRASFSDIVTTSSQPGKGWGGKGGRAGKTAPARSHDYEEDEAEFAPHRGKKSMMHHQSSLDSSSYDSDEDAKRRGRRGRGSADISSGRTPAAQTATEGLGIADLVHLVQKHVDSDSAVKLLRCMIQEKKAFVEQQKGQLKQLKERLSCEAAMPAPVLHGVPGVPGFVMQPYMIPPPGKWDQPVPEGVFVGLTGEATPEVDHLAYSLASSTARQPCM